MSGVVAGELVVADIGGTNARFAIATIGADGAIALDAPVTLATSDFDGLEDAWAAFARRLGRPLPRRAAIAVAAPITGAVLRMTNNRWVIETDALDRRLGVEDALVLNDFGAIAHAAARAPSHAFDHVCGPDRPLPDRGTITVVGPGTGLGVAHFHRFAGGVHVQATEGSHVDFAPVDAIDDALLARLRARHGRVSAERVVSGPGIVAIAEVLAAIDGDAAPIAGDAAVWRAGIAGTDPLARAAVRRFCAALGSVAGDFALAHGATGVVLAGGIAARLRALLPRSAFAERFVFKGRYEAMMADIPVKLITLDEPGLYGAAAASVSRRQLT